MYRQIERWRLQQIVVSIHASHMTSVMHTMVGKRLRSIRLSGLVKLHYLSWGVSVVPLVCNILPRRLISLYTDIGWSYVRINIVLAMLITASARAPSARFMSTLVQHWVDLIKLRVKSMHGYHKTGQSTSSGGPLYWTSHLQHEYTCHDGLAAFHK